MFLTRFKTAPRFRISPFVCYSLFGWYTCFKCKFTRVSWLWSCRNVGECLIRFRYISEIKKVHCATLAACAFTCIWHVSARVLLFKYVRASNGMLQKLLNIYISSIRLRSFYTAAVPSVFSLEHPHIYQFILNRFRYVLHRNCSTKCATSLFYHTDSELICS